MQEQTINQLLWRALEPASRYGGYFPVAQCCVQQLGDGDTFFSVEKIQCVEPKIANNFPKKLGNHS